MCSITSIAVTVSATSSPSGIPNPRSAWRNSTLSRSDRAFGMKSMPTSVSYRSCICFRNVPVPQPTSASTRPPAHCALTTLGAAGERRSSASNRSVRFASISALLAVVILHISCSCGRRLAQVGRLLFFWKAQSQQEEQPKAEPLVLKGCAECKAHDREHEQRNYCYVRDRRP